MAKVKSVMRSFTEKDVRGLMYLVIATIALCALFQPTAFAHAASLDNVLSKIGGVAGVVGGIILVVVLVKGIADYVKGEGTIGKIVIKVLCILLLVGLIVVATNIKTLQNNFGGIANSAVNVVQDEAKGVLQ